MDKILRKWRVIFENTTSHQGVPDPPGYDPSISELSERASVSRRKDTDITKKQHVLNTRAMSPMKQVGVMCFMMYMTGNTIQIFSLLTTISGIIQPISAIWKSGEVFKKDPSGMLDTVKPRLLYCLLYFGQILFGIYKLNAIGLLPTHSSDWVSALDIPKSTELSSTSLYN